MKQQEERRKGSAESGCCQSLHCACCRKTTGREALVPKTHGQRTACGQTFLAGATTAWHLGAFPRLDTQEAASAPSPLSHAVLTQGFDHVNPQWWQQQASSPTHHSQPLPLDFLPAGPSFCIQQNLSACPVLWNAAGPLGPSWHQSLHCTHCLKTAGREALPPSTSQSKAVHILQLVCECHEIGSFFV